MASFDAASDSHRVAFAGFSAFERSALATAFRLSTHRAPGYSAVAQLTEGELIVADGNHPSVVDEIRAAGLLSRTVFIGSQSPDGAAAWMMRPIDPHQVLRELDLLSSRLRETAQAAASATTLALPPAAATPQPAKPPATAPAPRTRPAAAAARRLASALIVDDSEVALRWLELKLERHGIRARLARSSQEALQAIAAERPDAVFVDLELGGASELDGLGLCRQLRQRARAAPDEPAPLLLMISAHNAPADRVRGALAGCDAYLGKPIEEAALRALLTQHGATATARA